MQHKDWNSTPQSPECPVKLHDCLLSGTKILDEKQETGDCRLCFHYAGAGSKEQIFLLKYLRATRLPKTLDAYFITDKDAWCLWGKYPVRVKAKGRHVKFQTCRWCATLKDEGE